MQNSLDPLSNDIAGKITCHYVNATSKLQVVRIENIENWYFERVVFPGQHLMFEALPEAILEVHTTDTATTIVADRIQCSTIRFSESIEPADINVFLKQKVS
ncbi:MAG: DUF1830 domain-containing protein [Cyanothece sp. SIO2G6]|nr:DUF1830 domain-containing protein [Cyanothece sp. SIO2G6]